ncbi:hypothetical protein CYMTET_7324 [Cymbomonas tetramitiformis]|uniref:Uncharacterized protein n=1 Tax=Cymbomonas tetramitiformis TaxID=36881 RepID=A0AAE0LHK2_9CHLO|nr:hypothetical protein CYMTET_7324 [Cymbomonas tetramitiformis]
MHVRLSSQLYDVQKSVGYSMTSYVIGVSYRDRGVALRCLDVNPLKRQEGLTSDGGIEWVCCGSFSSSVITFGTHALANTRGSGHFDMFIAKVNGQGTFLWVRRP